MASISLRTRLLDRSGQAADETVRRQASRFQALPELRGLLDALPHPLLILNGQRRIVFANRRLLELVGPLEPTCVHGLRPGDVLDCEHASPDHAECGATEACQFCGASRAIDLCGQGAETVQECRIARNDGTALDVRANSTPFSLAGEPFTVLALNDISDAKRRSVLERVFFHDLLNMTASMMGYAELLARVPPSEASEIGRLLAGMVRELADEIHAHRDLALAEAKDLKVHWAPVNARQMLAGVIETCRTLEAAADRTIVLHPATADVTFPSDKSLLTRVLGNMVKNALEASPPGHAVTVGCRASAENVDCWVHNDGTMPRDVQLQVFHRSFSTKGRGRGLGTYSIKLLTERYLHGRAYFTSAPEDGTVFTVSYPRVPPETQARDER